METYFVLIPAQQIFFLTKELTLKSDGDASFGGQGR